MRIQLNKSLNSNRHSRNLKQSSVTSRKTSMIQFTQRCHIQRSRRMVESVLCLTVGPSLAIANSSYLLAIRCIGRIQLVSRFHQTQMRLSSLMNRSPRKTPRKASGSSLTSMSNFRLKVCCLEQRKLFKRASTN